MKTINQFIGATGAFAVAAFAICAPSLLAQESGYSTTVVVPGQPPQPQPPPVVVQTPPPAQPPPSSTVIVNPPATPPPATVPRDVPDSYIWDDHEYVGMVGGQCYYLGPDNIWMPADKEALKHFHHWEKHHKDWREHAIQNEKYYKSHHEHDEDRDR